MTTMGKNVPRIYADFNKRGGDQTSEWLVLTCRGTFDDLRRLNMCLTEGLKATFYMDDADAAGNPDDIEVDGRVHFIAEDNQWVAVIDWSTLRHASDRQ